MRSAVNFSSECMQVTPKLKGINSTVYKIHKSEDCLYLNLFVPERRDNQVICLSVSVSVCLSVCLFVSIFGNLAYNDSRRVNIQEPIGVNRSQVESRGVKRSQEESSGVKRS